MRKPKPPAAPPDPPPPPGGHALQRARQFARSRGLPPPEPCTAPTPAKKPTRKTGR